MTAPSCQRWMVLAERHATGEAMSEPERRWYEAHTAQCRTCAGESRVWAALGEVATGRRPAVSPQRSTPVPSKREELRATARLPWYGLWKWGLLVGALIGAGAGAARWFRPNPIPTVPVVVAPVATFVSVSGEVQLGEKAIRSGEIWRPGEPLRTGRGHVCVSIDSSLTVCLDADSEMRLASLDAVQLRIQLDRGRLVSRLDTQSNSRLYVVQGSDVSITPQQSEFVAAIDIKRRMVVHLYEGRLAITRPNEQRTEIEAPSAAAVRDALEMSPLLDQDRAADQVLVHLARLPRVDRMVELDIVTRPIGARVAMDDQDLGPTPLSALIQSGRRLSVSMPGYATVAELLPTEPERKLQRNFELMELTATPTAVTTGASDKSAKTESEIKQSGESGAGESTITPQSLLEQAQSLRASGRISECVATYRQLVGTFPQSDEARVSLISLGELELLSLRQPAKALRSFESYLKQAGPLTREARFGRIRAFRMLRRKVEEQTAVAAFLRDYPNSAQADMLRSHKKPR